MGGLIPFLILISIFLGDKRDRRHSDMVRWLIMGSFVLGILGAFLSSPIGILALAGAGYYIYKRLQEKQEFEKRSQRYKSVYEKNTNAQPGYRGSDYQNGSYGKPADRNLNAHTSLPKRTSRRRKILEQFDRKYDLCLTDEQMTSIVNSSYMSEIWRKELEAMQEKYDHVSQWLLGGNTEWLRTYMYVFRIQEITSDIQEQEEIVKFSFESIFQYVDTLTGYGLSEKIRMVNAKYFTNFDDITFMTAYRFLESKGLNHDLSQAEVPTYHEMSEGDRLTEKYL